MADQFVEDLRSRTTPLLADGAMGTLLQARIEQALEGGFEELNLTAPEVVAQVHRDYVDAGAELITTNTFAANARVLGRADDVEALNRAGVDVARAVADAHGGVLVAGAVGPLGDRVQPYGRLDRGIARDVFAQQITSLAGVDLLAFETFTDHGELTAAIEAARKAAPGTPVVAHMTFGRDDRTLLGYLPGRVARELLDAGADVIGVNCSGGPAQTRRVVAAMRQSAPDALIAAQPNAGYAERVGGRMIFRASPAYFAESVAVLRELGAALVGGCCGTPPDHVRAMRRELDHPTAIVELPPAHVVEPPAVAEAAATARPTELAARLAEGRFTTTVEVTPPRSHDFGPVLESAALLRDAGAHLLDVADSPAARMRMSPWAVGQALQAEVGLETILHFPTRGRNLLRIQGDLLAVHAMGLRNLFVTMGDPTRIGDFPHAGDDVDIAPSALIGTIAGSMNAGEDLSGSSIGGPTSFTVGCAVNMCADDLEHELDVLERKEAGGAHFALGQAVFEPERIERFHAAYARRHDRDFTLPVLIGIIPLFSTRQAKFMHNEVPGITIPERIFARLEAAGEDAPAEGVRIAQELLAAVKPVVAGAYVIPSLGRYHLAAEVVASA